MLSGRVPGSRTQHGQYEPSHDNVNGRPWYVTCANAFKPDDLLDTKREGRCCSLLMPRQSFLVRPFTLSESRASTTLSRPKTNLQKAEETAPT